MIVSVVLAETVPIVAVMIIVPAVRAVTSPWLLIVATAVLIEIQVTELGKLFKI